MQELLKQMRILSLCKGPVRQRLKVLRRLAKSDAASLHWEEDAKTFEAARLKEASLEIAAAAKANDAAALKELHQELRDSQWRTPVPPILIRNTEAELRRIQVAAGVAQLNQLMPHIDAKYLEMDYSACRGLLDEWEGIVQKKQLTLPADLEEKIGPIRAGPSSRIMNLSDSAILSRCVQISSGRLRRPSRSRI